MSNVRKNSFLIFLLEYNIIDVRLYVDCKCLVSVNQYDDSMMYDLKMNVSFLLVLMFTGFCC